MQDRINKIAKFITAGSPRDIQKALQEDKKGEFYVEFDNDYSVYGTDSGFCYKTFATKRDAEEYAKKMNKTHKMP